ncbi:MAG: hypothetical protein M3P93_13980 [Actinomycetota bacterium]|jgi:hypothetical protein|nr:hypothetical protein [Actinomycetota bacterium]
MGSRRPPPDAWRVAAAATSREGSPMRRVQTSVYLFWVTLALSKALTF